MCSLAGVVIDSSSLISLARSGQLAVLDRLPVPPRLLDVVWREVVDQGKAAQHADAFAIEAVLANRPIEAAPDAPTVDEAVLRAAVGERVLLTNDLTLGRRARNLGVRWLRTADLFVLLHRTNVCTSSEAQSGIDALWSAGRITAALRDEYLEVLR